MNAVAAPEPTTTTTGNSGLNLSGKAAVVAAPEKNRPSKIASSRAAADLDDSADEEQQVSSSSPYAADPTLETCCHVPAPIALNPLNSFLFAGEKVLRLPIPPTNDIVVSVVLLFFWSSRCPRKKKGHARCRNRWLPYVVVLFP